MSSENTSKKYDVVDSRKGQDRAIPVTASVLTEEDQGIKKLYMLPNRDSFNTHNMIIKTKRNVGRANGSPKPDLNVFEDNTYRDSQNNGTVD